MTRKSKPRLNNPRNSLNQFTSRKALGLTTIRQLQYFDQLTEWAYTRFKWNYLPDGCNERYLETTLFYGGLCVFYFDERFGEFMCVRATGAGEVDVYGEPLYFDTASLGTYVGVRLPKEKCVPIWNNLSRTGLCDTIVDYSKRLGDIETTLDIVSKNMRTTRIVTCEESQRLTMQNVIREVDEGVPVIFGTSALDLASINVLDLTIDKDYLPRLRHERNQIWRDALTFLGITSVNEDKKERLVSDEASGQDGQVIIARNSLYRPRKEAVDAINEKWGLEIEVKWCFEEETIPDMLAEGNINV